MRHQQLAAVTGLFILFAVPGLQFVSLQQAGPKPAEDLPLIHFMNEMTDFAGTAIDVYCPDGHSDGPG